MKQKALAVSRIWCDQVSSDTDWTEVLRKTCDTSVEAWIIVQEAEWCTGDSTSTESRACTVTEVNLTGSTLVRTDCTCSVVEVVERTPLVLREAARLRVLTSECHEATVARNTVSRCVNLLLTTVSRKLWVCVVSFKLKTVEVCTQDVVNNTRNSVRTVYRRRAVEEDVNALNHCTRDHVEVWRRRNTTNTSWCEATTVYEYECTTWIKTTKRSCRRTWTAFCVDARRCRNASCDLLTLNNCCLTEKVRSVYETEVTRCDAVDYLKRRSTREFVTSKTGTRYCDALLYGNFTICFFFFNDHDFFVGLSLLRMCRRERHSTHEAREDRSRQQA